MVFHHPPGVATKTHTEDKILCELWVLPRRQIRDNNMGNFRYIFIYQSLFFKEEKKSYLKGFPGSSDMKVIPEVY